jgi:preprotein translocase subunit YajC
MSIIGMIVMLVFFAAVVMFLNYGRQDKDFKRRETYWAKFQGK